MSYQHTGNCPRCGAPIYAHREMSEITSSATEPAPTAHFTCECRHTLPKALPEIGEDVVESVDEADRKHLARNRPVQKEEPSAERSE